jgi:hypothetical protein
MKTTFRFLAPDSDGNVIDIKLIAEDLDEAFTTFAAEYAAVTREFAVWRGQTLCARTVPGNTNTGPKLIEFSIYPSFPRTYACGD